MQRFIAVRVLQSLLAILVMSMIVFGLARLSGNPLDVMLPIEAMPEDYERLEKHWGLDKPFTTQYVIFIKKAVQGDFGQAALLHQLAARLGQFRLAGGQRGLGALDGELEVGVFQAYQ